MCFCSNQVVLTKNRKIEISLIFLGCISMEEALVDNNLHFKRFGSFAVLVQPERKNTCLRQ